jgi:hypothetical protein
MLRTFRRKPAPAYTINDSVLTLGIEERMREEDGRMYAALGFEGRDISPLRPTQRSRVAAMITKSIARAAAGSVLLSGRARLSSAQAPAVHSQRALTM